MDKENIWLDQLIEIRQISRAPQKIAKDHVEHLGKVVDLLFSEPALFVLEREDLHCYHLFTNLGSGFVFENILF